VLSDGKGRKFGAFSYCIPENYENLAQILQNKHLNAVLLDFD
jgi:hypothetical protein